MQVKQEQGRELWVTECLELRAGRGTSRLMTSLRLVDQGSQHSSSRLHKLLRTVTAIHQG